MNRDEKLTRAAGLPPRLAQINGRRILSPGEPNGGTWIGVNDTGATLALINWYAIAACVTDRAFSRGEVVRSCLPAHSADGVDQTLAELPLSRTNPFRLIGVFPFNRAVLEWRWDLRRLERCEHRWQSDTWISSGFDEPGAQQTRGKAFRKSLRQKSAGSLDWLRRLHRSHAPERGAYSHCLHRVDAATVSYTEVAVARQKAAIRYTPGTPCCTAPMPTLCLQLIG